MRVQKRLVDANDYDVVKKIKLTEAKGIAGLVITLLDTVCDKIEVVGSIRRSKRVVHDIDFVVIATDRGWKEVEIVAKGIMDGVIVAGGKQVLRTLVPFHGRYYQVDFYRATEDNYGIVKLVRTGSAEHNIWLAKRALRMGMKLQYSKGLINRDGKIIAGRDEEGVFKGLGLEYIEPHLREIVNGKPKWMK